ncbi:MAG: hypothetical protein M1503_12620 [Thaumarchaeota archaeon]|nr:hypothetical protein [Nitrososphaerota archaeon]MCL5319083.1 hypothetical protein [Nitrososphaerota archaeon]
MSNGPPTPLRPEWLREGHYVTYLVTVTKGGVTQTSYIKETVIDVSGATLNPMRIESFEAHISPNLQLSMGNLQSITEDAFDINFMTIEEKVAVYKPEIELVRGLNNKTYEAYRLTCNQILDVVSPGSDCNLIVWFEKETLIKVRQLQWHEENGMNVTYQQLTEDSNIQGLAISPSTTNTTSTPVKTVTTTIFVKSPQTVVTITTTFTETTIITGPQSVETTTVTETRNGSENTTAAIATATIPISAGILVAGAIVSIVLLKKRAN